MIKQNSFLYAKPLNLIILFSLMLATLTSGNIPLTSYLICEFQISFISKLTSHENIIGFDFRINKVYKVKS